MSAKIRIGLHLHPPPRQSVEAFIDTVKRADRYGFARIGTGDTQWHNMECFIALTLMALNSDKVEIGPRVTNPVTRRASVMASAIVSLDLLSRGRAVLTIGRGDSAVTTSALNQPASKKPAITLSRSVICWKMATPLIAAAKIISIGRARRRAGAFPSASPPRVRGCSGWPARLAIRC